MDSHINIKEGGAMNWKAAERKAAEIVVRDARYYPAGIGPEGFKYGVRYGGRTVFACETDALVRKVTSIIYKGNRGR